MLDLQAISCLALICLGFLMTFRNLNTSWIGRLWIIGKAVNTTAMRSVIRSVVIGLGISVIFVYLFLTPSPLESPNYYYLSVAILNGIASLLLTLIVYKESYYAKYLAHTFFVQALSMFYLFSLVPIMFIKFILNDISLPVYNFMLIVFAIVALTQAFTMPRTEFEEKITSSSFLQRLQVGTPKKDFEEVKDIVIIDIEEGVKPEKIKPKKIEKKEPMTSSDGKMIILLGLIIPLQFLIINFYINPSVFIPIPFVEYQLITLPFSWGDLDFIISMIGLGIVIISILFYFGSKKVQDWYLNKIPLQAAFWEFLTLIERKERMQVLTEMADVIRETLISGIMDFIDSAREDFQSTIYYGREFFRRLFGIE